MVPLERLLSDEWLALEEREVALSVEGEIGGDFCPGDFANRRKPIDGTGGGVDDGVGFNPFRPMGDARGVERAIPEAVFVSPVGSGGSVVAIFLSGAE